MKDFHVAKIIDEYKIIINAGTDDSIERDDQFIIFGKEAQDLTDPVTDESLGMIGDKKATVRVLNLYPKFSICVNVERKPNIFESANAINPAMLKTISQFSVGPAELNVDTSQISGEIDMSNEPIRIGDKAELRKNN